MKILLERRKDYLKNQLHSFVAAKQLIVQGRNGNQKIPQTFVHQQIKPSPYKLRSNFLESAIQHLQRRDNAISDAVLETMQFYETSVKIPHESFVGRDLETRR